MRHPLRRRKFGRWVCGIWRPIAALFRDFDKASTQRQRWMTRSISDGEHLVPQRGNQKHVHLGENAAHLVGDLAAKAIGLDKIHRRKKARLAKRIWPRVRYLHLQLIHAVAERQLLE